MKASDAAGTEAVRGWAKRRGMKVGERGKLPQWIIDRYDRAHPPVPNPKGKSVPVSKKIRSGPVGPVAKPKATPDCPKHEVSMVFHAVKQVWECPQRETDNCRIIHRPVESKEDGRVLLGEGDLQLRLLVHKDENDVPINRVILISDNDVALDITPYVNVGRLLDVFDADIIINKASQRGRKIADIEVSQPIPLKMKLSIHGID